MQLTSAQLVVSINLGGSPFINTSRSSLNDGQWHTVNAIRTGLNLSLTIDNLIVAQVVLPGPHFTLEYNSSKVFIGGQPSLNGTVIDGYHGCLEDLRLNDNSLPLSGSTDFASVTFVGGNAMSGCTIGTCSPNPCEPGNCTENTNNKTISCSCPDGSITDNNCSTDREVTPFGVIAIGIARLYKFHPIFVLQVCATRLLATVHQVKMDILAHVNLAFLVEIAP